MTDDEKLKLAIAIAKAKGSAPQTAQDRSFGQAVYDNVIGDPNDGVQSYGEALGTWLNRAGETMTLGVVGDEASAAAYAPAKRALASAGMGGDPNATYEGELGRFRQNEDDMSTGGQISADLLGALIPGMFGAGAVSGGASLLGQIGRGAAFGGASGGLYGFMEGEGGLENRLDNARWSGMIGGGMGGIAPIAANAVKGAVGKALEGRAVRRATRGAPSTEDLRRMGQEAYKAVDDAGVRLAPDAVRGAASDITADMLSSGLDTGPMSLTPKSARVADILAEAVPEGSNGVPFRNIELIRRKAGAPASDMGNKLESALGSRAISGLDDFVNGLTPDQVVAGNADDLASNIATARDVWSRMSRSQMIDDAIDASETYLGGQASGIRNQFARILRNPKLSRGFSEVEKRAMKRVVNGSIPEQMLNLVGGGMGQLAAIGGGAAAGGPLGAIGGMGAAALARRGSEALALRNAEVVRALIASGGMQKAPQMSPVLRALLDAELLGSVPGAAFDLQSQLQPQLN